MEPKTDLPDLNKAVAALLKKRDSSLRALSLQMGHSHNYLSTALQRRNLPIGLLLELSRALEVNLLELYLPQLPAHVRATAVERGLHQRINDLTAELHRVTEEKDRYWKVIEKK